MLLNFIIFFTFCENTVMKSYQCIQCGWDAKELYRDFKGGIIKIAHCVHCHEVVDKYTEYEPVIVFLDALLLKTPAYRHILVNTDYKSPWKLVIILLFCDAFTKLVEQRSARSSRVGRLEPDYVFYSALEWDLYWNIFMASAELLVFLGVVILLWIVWMKRKRKSTTLHEYQMVVRALVMSDFGKILLIPVMLWGQTYSVFYIWICHVFVLASNIQALKVVSIDCSLQFSFILVCLGYTAQWFVVSWLPAHWTDVSSSVLPFS
ncbi:protein ARV1-like [Gigantopelta aegis]|uniref:protein ARV1-like n=1 Tax=Gigantopelta aegis TaxID=1735272 RepID=UPI001B888754|nr:protein ARV1-like [Gigantopelta aegis]